MTSRLEVVVAQLALDDGGEIVEVGCGHGVAATLALERLTSGSYTGIDRSATMITAARQRNAAAVATGRASFVEAAIEDVAERAGGPFDCLFAARVAALARPSGLAAADELLRPGGRLLLAIDAPDEARARSAAADSSAAVQAAGYRDVRRIDEAFDGGTVALVSAIR